MKNGKRGSRFNATTHGIFGDILLSGGHLGEDEEHYIHLLSSLRVSIRPRDQYEDLLVGKLTSLYWRLTRVHRADVQIAPKLFAKVSEVLDENHQAVKTEFIDKKSEVVVVGRDPAPDLLMRYEASIERQITRTMDELERWRCVLQGASDLPAGK